MVHSSWSSSVEKALCSLNPPYRDYLENDKDFFPDRENYLNAFRTLPKDSVRYILFGQDPYPRVESATGYAFIDGKVKNIFSDNGLSKEVNRATSLRNFIKMLLVASGDLTPDDTSQPAISKIDKSDMIDSIEELRSNLEKNGVLLLNTALVFSSKEESRYHIGQWKPFVEALLSELGEQSPKLILFGNHAKDIKKLSNTSIFEAIELEHPYNHSFIHNEQAHDLFGPMNLLAK